MGSSQPSPLPTIIPVYKPQDGGPWRVNHPRGVELDTITRLESMAYARKSMFPYFQTLLTGYFLVFKQGWYFRRGGKPFELACTREILLRNKASVLTIPLNRLFFPHIDIWAQEASACQADNTAVNIVHLNASYDEKRWIIWPDFWNDSCLLFAD